MKLLRYLGNLGYGSRKDVARLLREGQVRTRSGVILREGDPFEHAEVQVDGEPLDPAPGVVLLLNKPVGYVCSTRDSGLLVYDLLPPRFARRSPIIAPVGRLDRATSGLLLLTDDGQLSHRIRSPRTHLPKVYEAQLAEPLRGDEAELFASGTMLLASESTPLKRAVLEEIGDRRVRITLTEGRYHQVRRMFGATGNRVDALHRVGLGGLGLGGLEPGQWRELAPDEVATLRA